MDSTYAPQSPDLSSFLSSPPKTQQLYHQPQPSSTAYAPRSPVIPSFNSPAAPAPTSQHNLQLPYNHNQLHPFGGGYGGGTLQPEPVNFEFDTYGNTQYMPPIPALPPQHSFENQQHQEPTNPLPYYHPQQQQQQEQQQYIPIYNSSDSYIPVEETFPQSPNMTSRPPRGGKGGLSSAGPPQQHAPIQQYKNPNPNNIEIKTKFPVARIKRIMQADEEVGKVAQVTPVAVSKALELFMIALVSGAADKAKEKGGKRVTAQHLKQVVMSSPEQFDFLAEIVGRVAEVTEGAGGEGRKRKEKNVKSEEGSESSEEEPKKVRKGKGGRKKKSDD